MGEKESEGMSKAKKSYPLAKAYGRITLKDMAEQAMDLVREVDDSVYEEHRSFELRQALRETANFANIVLDAPQDVQPSINDKGEEEE
jgi:hypothetical protein